MVVRKNIAIYIDYSIRIPNFKTAYESFKNSLFVDMNGVDFEDELTEDDVRFFWTTELKNPIVEQFYISKDISKINDDKLNGDFQPYFYNEEHLLKFLDDYSYNLYSDCTVPSNKDIELINICQDRLFDVILIDRIQSKRKIGNTFFFLSKIRIYPRNVIFLRPQQEINKDNFFGIWNPMEEQEHFNDSSDNFLNWLQALEKKNKELLNEEKV